MITHMQQLRFSSQAPERAPEAAVWVRRPEQAGMIPPNCLSLYLMVPMNEAELGRLMGGLPAGCLVVDYHGNLAAGDFGLRPKAELEARVSAHWRAMEDFLTQRGIDPGQLRRGPAELLDDAIDLLLEYNQEFLQLAVGFQYALNLARPLRTIGKTERERFDLVISLAHQVQALTPGALPAQFLKTYADDSFLLNDHRWRGEGLAAAIARHQLAGRQRLAEALSWQAGLQSGMSSWVMPAQDRQLAAAVS